MDTIVEKKGFGTRMKNSVGGIFGGILIFLLGIGLLIFNEANNVKNIKKVKELRSSYTDVTSDSVNKDYDGKLIATNGKLDFGEEELKDEKFNIVIKTPVLVRKVEIYQWKEEKTESDDKTTYEYKQVWDDEIIDSSKFKDSSSHSNPTSIPYDEYSTRASKVKVGAYNLSGNIINQITANKTYTNLSDATLPEGYKVDGEYITNSANLNSPNVGDVRISFKYGDYNDVSVLGQLTGDTIGEYKTTKGVVVSKFEEGTKSGAELINDIESSDKMLKWILRLVGTLFIICGVASVFKPLQTITSYVPIVGGLVNGVTGLISLFIGLGISLFIIAVSWIVVRPLIGIALLLVVVVIIILLKKLLSKNKQQVVQPQMQQQVGFQPVQPNPMNNNYYQQPQNNQNNQNNNMQ